MLVVGLTAFGCAHGSGDMELGAQHSEPNGHVDLSESPTLARERGFWPGQLIGASEPASWVAAEELDAPITHLELRNACRLDLDYVFAPSGDPGSAEQARRNLAGYTIQTQVIPSGHWLHLFDGERWLATAVVSVSAGVMQVAPDCETLEVSYALDQRDTRFAIHWQLDVDIATTVVAAGLPELAREQLELRESWAPPELAGIELRLANSCAEPLDYAFTPTLDQPPERRSTLPAHSERVVEVPAGWWLKHRVDAGSDDAGWRSGVTTDHAGGVLWLSANCIDHGVGDGRVVSPGAGGVNVD